MQFQTQYNEYKKINNSELSSYKFGKILENKDISIFEEETKKWIYKILNFMLLADYPLIQCDRNIEFQLSDNTRDEFIFSITNETQQLNFIIDKINGNIIFEDMNSTVLFQYDMTEIIHPQVTEFEKDVLNSNYIIPLTDKYYIQKKYLTDQLTNFKLSNLKDFPSFTQVDELTFDTVIFFKIMSPLINFNDKFKVEFQNGNDFIYLKDKLDENFIIVNSEIDCFKNINMTMGTKIIMEDYNIPVNDNDICQKKYVDTRIGGISTVTDFPELLSYPNFTTNNISFKLNNTFILENNGVRSFIYFDMINNTNELRFKIGSDMTYRLLANDDSMIWYMANGESSFDFYKNVSIMGMRLNNSSNVLIPASPSEYITKYYLDQEMSGISPNNLLISNLSFYNSRIGETKIFITWNNTYGTNEFYSTEYIQDVDFQMNTINGNKLSNNTVGINQLNNVSMPSDGEILSFEYSTGKFNWITNSSSLENNTVTPIMLKYGNVYESNTNTFLTIQQGEFVQYFMKLSGLGDYPNMVCDGQSEIEFENNSSTNFELEVNNNNTASGEKESSLILEHYNYSGNSEVNSEFYSECDSNNYTHLFLNLSQYGTMFNISNEPNMIVSNVGDIVEPGMYVNGSIYCNSICVRDYSSYSNNSNALISKYYADATYEKIGSESGFIYELGEYIFKFQSTYVSAYQGYWSDHFLLSCGYKWDSPAIGFSYYWAALISGSNGGYICEFRANKYASNTMAYMNESGYIYQGSHEKLKKNIKHLCDYDHDILEIIKNLKICSFEFKENCQDHNHYKKGLIIENPNEYGVIIEHIEDDIKKYKEKGKNEQAEILEEMITYDHRTCEQEKKEEKCKTNECEHCQKSISYNNIYNLNVHCTGELIKIIHKEEKEINDLKNEIKDIYDILKNK